MNIYVSSAGAYWPRSALTRRGSSLRVCAHDQDAVTLSVEAGMAALEVSDISAEKLDGLYLALGASPLAEGPIEQIVSNALGLKDTISTATFSGNELASLSALFSAGDAVDAKRMKNVLVIAAEGGGSPKDELPGAAAVALVVSDNGDDTVITIESVQQDGNVVFHRWRQNPVEASSESDNRFLKQYYNKRVTQVLGSLEKDVGKLNHAVFTGAPKKAVREVLNEAFGGNIASLNHSVDPGNYGVAGPFLGLLTGLETVSSGERFLSVSHGSGQTVAMSLLAGKLKTTRVEPPAKELRSVSVGDDVITPANPRLPLPAMSPFFWRNRDWFLRLEAHRCINCGFVAFPPSERPICRECHSMKWEPYLLPRKGRVYTYCVNNYTAAGFPRQIVHILADLEDGTRLWGPATEMQADEVSIGVPVRIAFRRYTQEEGALVYGMKFISYMNGGE